MPIFGNTTDVSTGSGDISDGIRFQRFQMGGTGGTADSITVKLVKSGSGSFNVKCAIYDASLNLLANGVTEEKTFSEAAATYTTFNFIGIKPLLAAGAFYHLCAWADSAGATGFMRARSIVGFTVWEDTLAYGDFPSSLTKDITFDNWSSLIYCTYTETEAEEELPPSPPTWPKETYISGYLPRYQKRELIGLFSRSGDLRPVEVNASGQLLTDVEVAVSSGLHTIISGQPVTISGDHVYVESGARVVTTFASGQGTSGNAVSVSGNQVEAHIMSGVISISGQPVTISGGHVYLESGPYSTVAHLYGYHHGSGIWVPLAVTLSGCLATVYCQSGSLF